MLLKLYHKILKKIKAEEYAPIQANTQYTLIERFLYMLKEVIHFCIDTGASFKVYDHVDRVMIFVLDPYYYTECGITITFSNNPGSFEGSRIRITNPVNHHYMDVAVSDYDKKLNKHIVDGLTDAENAYLLLQGVNIKI